MKLDSMADSNYAIEGLIYMSTLCWNARNSMAQLVRGSD